MLDSDLLVGSFDIAKRLGLKRIQNVHHYVKNDPTFPAPMANIGGSMLWSWPDVEEWAATRTFRQRTPPVHAPRSKDFQAAMERLGLELGRKPSDLVGAYEIAHRLGFQRTMSVHQLMRDESSGFPAAVARIDPARATWIWWWPDVEKWAEEHLPDRVEAWRKILADEPLTGQDEAVATGRPEEAAAGEWVGSDKAKARKRVG